MLGQIVGRLGDPEADDEGEPGVLDRVQVPGRRHPGIGHDHQIRNPVPFLEGCQDRDDRRGLGLVALEQVGFEREAGRVDEQTDLDLRVDPMFLAHADLAQLLIGGGVVLVGDLEIQAGEVIMTSAPSRPAREENPASAAAISARYSRSGSVSAPDRASGWLGPARQAGQDPQAGA